MNANHAARQFTELFRDVYRRFHRRVRHTDYQLSGESLAILQHLADAGPLTVTEAARHMDRSQAAMSELIARLVERQVLARMQDRRDRRRTLIWLTAHGRTVLQRATSVLSDARLEQALAKMSRDERTALIESIQRLLATPHAKGDAYDE